MVSRLLRYLGGWFVLNDPKDDIPDPATGLTPKHKRSIRENWDLVKKDTKKNGVDLFIKLFRDHPYTQDFFEQLKGQSLDTLATSSKMRAHATTVMYSLTSLVDSLDDPECLVGLARKISANHLRNGVQMKEFDVTLNFSGEIAPWRRVLGLVNNMWKCKECEGTPSTLRIGSCFKM